MTTLQSYMTEHGVTETIKNNLFEDNNKLKQTTVFTALRILKEDEEYGKELVECLTNAYIIGCDERIKSFEEILKSTKKMAKKYKNQLEILDANEALFFIKQNIDYMKNMRRMKAHGYERMRVVLDTWSEESQSQLSDNNAMYLKACDTNKLVFDTIQESLQNLVILLTAKYYVMKKIEKN
jgi:hypothetical protein